MRMKPVATPGERSYLNVGIPRQLHKRIQAVALHDDLTMADLVASILGPEINRRFAQVEEPQTCPK